MECISELLTLNTAMSTSTPGVPGLLECRAHTTGHTVDINMVLFDQRCITIIPKLQG